MDLRGIEETGNNLPHFHNPEVKTQGKKNFNSLSPIPGLHRDERHCGTLSEFGL
jgi:hypothetical protein